MKYRFEEIDICTPGKISGACGQLNPIEVEWDINAGGWPACLHHGVESIKVESSAYVGRNPETGAAIYDDQLVDITMMSAPEADFLTYVVGKEISHRMTYDKKWMREMEDAFDNERRREAETRELNAADLKRKLWLVG